MGLVLARANELLQGIYHSWLEWLDTEPTKNDQNRLKFAEFEPGEQSKIQVPVYIEWNHAKNPATYKLVHFDENGKLKNFPVVHWETLNPVYPFYYAKNEKDVRRQFCEIGGLLLLCRNPHHFNEWPSSIRNDDRKFAEYRKNWNIRKVPTLVGNRKPEKSGPPRSFESHERKQLEESGPITGPALDRLKVRPKELPLLFRTVDTQNGIFERILEKEDKGVDEVRRTIVLLSSLVYMTYPRRDPKNNVARHINPSDVDGWVTFLLDTRIPVWIWEFGTYRDSLEALRTIGLYVKVEDEQRKNAKLATLIRITRGSLLSLLPISISRFNTKSEGHNPTETLSDWIQTSEENEAAVYQTDQAIKLTRQHKTGVNLKDSIARLAHMLEADTTSGSKSDLDEFADAVHADGWDGGIEVAVDSFKQFRGMQTADEGARSICYMKGFS
ncbi:hypothetical protein N0V95_001784 [Ascochyta clinopodiicola]|nr:hypothetical protein N0V95_001784 [Ascochyta clinopodiicola]